MQSTFALGYNQFFRDSAIPHRNPPLRINQDIHNQMNPTIDPNVSPEIPLTPIRVHLELFIGS